MDATMDTCLAGLASRGFTPRCVIDVGAADAGWARHTRTYWPTASFVLFEPLIERAPEIERFIADYPGISWLNCGLGRNRTTLGLSIYDNLYASSFAYGGPSIRHVPVETLDLLFAEKKIPQGDFMKIDVQGFELEVLAGAENYLKEMQVVILESNFYRFAPQMSLVHEAIALMHSKGFHVYEILDQVRRPLDNAIGQCDICFVRETHALLKNNLWG